MFDMFHERVFRAAYYITRDRHLAQDVLQETFVKAYKHMDRVKEGEKIGAWLTVIATNTAIDHMRKRKVWNGMPTEDVILLQALEQDEVASSVEQEVEREFEKEQLRRQMEYLKPEYRQVLLLKYHQGLRDDESAELLGVTVGTVKSRVHRAKHQLKKLLVLAERESLREPAVKEGE